MQHLESSMFYRVCIVDYKLNGFIMGTQSPLKLILNLNDMYIYKNISTFNAFIKSIHMSLLLKFKSFFIVYVFNAKEC